MAYSQKSSTYEEPVPIKSVATYKTPHLDPTPYYATLGKNLDVVPWNPEEEDEPEKFIPGIYKHKSLIKIPE